MSLEKNKYKIIIVDDNSEVREAAKDILGKDYELEIFSKPEEAINYDKEFDLLITDFYFGDEELNGSNIINSCRERKNGLDAILINSGFNQYTTDWCRKNKVLMLEKFKDDFHPLDKKELTKLVKYYAEDRKPLFRRFL